MARLVPGDVIEPIHVRMLDAMRAMLAEERTVSVLSLCDVLGGEEEIVSGLTLREYLMRLGLEGVVLSITPAR